MYFFIKESTPAGYTIKIMPSSWQFIVFDEKGNSVDIHENSPKLTYSLPIIIFIGENFKISRDYSKEYHLLKIRNGSMIIPYREKGDKITRYAFAATGIKLDLVPVRIVNKTSLSVMMKEIDAKTVPDWLLIDNSVSDNDLYIIKRRYHAENIIRTAQKETHIEEEGKDTGDHFYNLNILSQNPVFLTASHLRSMDIANLNQLILDFELTPIDLEAIIRYIDIYLNDPNVAARNKDGLQTLKLLSNFYLQLLLRNDNEINELIENESNSSRLYSFEALVMKVKMLLLGSSDVDIITAYEEKLKNKGMELAQ